MPIMSEIITPIFQLLIYIVMGGWLLFIIWLVLKKLFKNFGLHLKYKVFKKAWPEKYVDWCMRAYELGWNEAKVKMHLLLNNKPDKTPYKKKEIKEILYIFYQVVKNSEKGGVEDVRNKPSNEQIEAIKEK